MGIIIGSCVTQETTSTFSSTLIGENETTMADDSEAVAADLSLRRSSAAAAAAAEAADRANSDSLRPPPPALDPLAFVPDLILIRGHQRRRFLYGELTRDQQVNDRSSLVTLPIGMSAVAIVLMAGRWLLVGLSDKPASPLTARPADQNNQGEGKTKRNER